MKFGGKCKTLKNHQKKFIFSHRVMSTSHISIGNYTVREVLMKNRTRVWRKFIIPRVRSTSGIINISPNTSVIFH
jgi:hypothetical protein